MRTEATDKAARLSLRERLLAGVGMSVERFPTLQAVFDNMAAAFTSHVQTLSDLPSEFLVENVASVRAIDVLTSYDNRIQAAYRVLDAESRILISADHDFVYLLLELMFGSDGAEPSYERERSLSKIETRVGQHAFEKLAKALKAALSITAGIEFSLERVNGKLELPTGSRKNGFALICNCKLRTLNREGGVFIVIPQTLIEPFKQALSCDPLNEASRTDPEWAKRMRSRVTQAEITVRATMEKRDFTLYDIACLEVGQVVSLPISPDGLIKLECETQPLFWCTLGQKDEAYTIRVEEFIDQNEEFIDEVLGS
jgi:flagellar motor switch protein FliM